MEELTPTSLTIIVALVTILSKLVDALIKSVGERTKRSSGPEDRAKAAHNHVLWPYIEDVRQSQEAFAESITKDMAGMKKTVERIDLSIRGDGTKDGTGLVSEIKLHALAIEALERRSNDLERRVGVLEKPQKMT